MTRCVTRIPGLGRHCALEPLWQRGYGLQKLCVRGVCQGPSLSQSRTHTPERSRSRLVLSPSLSLPPSRLHSLRIFFHIHTHPVFSFKYTKHVANATNFCAQFECCKKNQAFRDLTCHSPPLYFKHIPPPSPVTLSHSLSLTLSLSLTVSPTHKHTHTHTYSYRA